MLPLVPWFERLSRQVLVRLFLSMLAPAALLAPAAAHALTYTVNSTGDSGTGTGQSGDLRYVITQANANSGGTIQFAVTGTITLTSALPQITQNVTIFGSGPAVLTISGASSYQVFNIGSSATVTINGMTIANGNGTNGGAISNAGTLSVDNAAFTGNSANLYGGAISNTGTLTVDGVSFSGNNSGFRGGAIYSSGSGVLNVSSSTFSGNSAFSGGGAIGAITAATVTNSTFSGNSSSGSGGAIFSQGNALTVTNSTFSANSGISDGGGIYAQNGTATVNNSIFTGNYSITDGGISNGGTLNGSNNILGADINGECGGTGTGCFTNGANGNQVGVSASSIGLLPLGHYGSSMQTMALRPGSAAICAGLQSAAVDASSNPLHFDQRSFAMDPSCAAGSVDAGAVQTNQYVVNSLIDSGDGSDNCSPEGSGTTCSLRDAISDAASAGGDVTFLPSLTSAANPGTINLSAGGPGGTGSSLTIGRGNILGPGANQLSISGDDDTSVGSVIVVNSGAQAFLYGLTITQGYTQNSPGGGGIYNQGTLTLMASVVSSSLTDSGLNGAGIANEGTLTLTGSTVSGNQIIVGSGSGGGIFSVGTLTLTESTVEGNSVPFQSTGGGGGIYVAVGSATLSASTVSGNTATQFCPPFPHAPCQGGAGGGIYNGGTLAVTNSILAGNSGQGGANTDDCAGSCPANGSSNLVGGIPQLSSPQQNGPLDTVPTMIPLPGSPAICAGLPNYLPTGLTTDERGYPYYNTTYPGYSPASPCVDAGAVQTNYAIGFSTQPPSNAFTGVALSPAPVVQLTENGNLATAATSSVAMTDSSTLLTGTASENFASGSATFDNLIVPSAYSNDLLTATLALNPTVNLTSQASVGIDVIVPVPAVSLSLTSVSFGSEPVGYSTATQSVTLTNTGTGPLTIGSIGLTGPDLRQFASSNNCGTSLAAGATCRIGVRFAPSAAKPATAAITLTDNAADSPQSIALSGTGIPVSAASLTLSTNNLSFGSEPVGYSSAAQGVTVTNSSAGIIYFHSIVLGGDSIKAFATSNTCSASLAVGASCRIGVRFVPNAPTPLSATITLTDNAGDSPEVITLGGTGIPALPASLTLSTSSLSFGNEATGSSTAAQAVIVTNTGANQIYFQAITLAGANPTSFATSNTCGATLAPGATCRIGARFAPVVTGPLAATITLTDNATDSPETITLSGTGQ